MQYREYGKTGKMVSLLGFGTSRFRPTDYASDEGNEKLVKLLLSARKCGINYFDTWDSYGDGRCEEILGIAFKRMDGDFYVSTKSHDSSFDAADMRRRLEASLKRMQIEKIHFYHMWRILNIGQFHGFLRKGGVFEGALRAKEEGLIDHLCLSAHCSSDEIVQIVRTGYFEGILLGYNIVNSKYRERGIEIAKECGLGVAVMNPLGGGAILRNEKLFSSALHDDESIVDLSLNFCAANKGVSVVLSGMTDERELLQNVAAINKVDDFPGERIQNTILNIGESLSRLCNGCRYCQGCPANIAIDKILMSFDRYALYDFDPRIFFEAIGNYGRKPHAPYPCTNCGLCETKCSQHISIRKCIHHVNELIQQRTEHVFEGLERCFKGPVEKAIGIYGAGEYAKEMLREYLEVYRNLNVNLVVFDSNPDKHGKHLSPYNFVIRSPRDIAVSGIDRMIIASEDNYNEIYESLKTFAENGMEIMKFTLGKQYRKISFH